MLKRLLALSALALLASCGGASQPTPVLDANGQPTGQMVQQQQSPGLLGMFGASLAGNMVGNLLSSGRGGGSVVSGPAPTHTVINKTVVNKTIIVAPPAVKTSPSVSPPKPTTTFRSSGSSSYTSRSYSRGGRR